MITYQVERFENVIDEVKPLLEAHYKEIALHQDKMQLNPDYKQYQGLQDLDILHIVTVRDEGILIGYFVSIIVPHLHYKDHVCANNDILFVAKEYRGSMIGIKMFKYAEKELKKLGVSVISLHTKVHADFGTILERIGYEHVEQTYSKYVGDY